MLKRKNKKQVIKRIQHKVYHQSAQIGAMDAQEREAKLQYKVGDAPMLGCTWQ